MPASLKARLCLMMFLNYIIWGSWYVTIGTYLTANLKFTGAETGRVFGTTALAAMISPLFVGLIADRYFATQKVLATLHILGAVLLYCVTLAHSFWAVFAIMLAYCLLFFPTVGLTNSLTLRQLTDAGGEFPFIRMFATIGWVVIAQVISALSAEASPTPFLLGSGASVLMAAYCLTLPDTPPTAGGKKITVGSLIGLDALVMLKKKAYLVFAIASILACIPLIFYFVFANAYLNEIGVTNSASKMSLGQVSEVGVMLLMPFIFRRITVRGVLMLGLLCWSVRYGLLASGNAQSGMWMFYIAILLHGFCFDFFFMTGQLYTDQEAPPALRGTAQGFLTFITYGVGFYIGSNLSGVALDYFTTPAGKNWNAFWLCCAAGSFAILLLVAALFRTNAKIQTKS